MSEIKFTHLSELSLNGNGISSIEVFSRIHLSIRQLQICTNESIQTKTKSARSRTCARCIGPNAIGLTMVDVLSKIGDNFIQDASTLTQMHMKAMQVFSIDYNGALQQNDVRDLVKLELADMKELCTYESNRHLQPSQDQTEAQA